MIERISKFIHWRFIVNTPWRVSDERAGEPEIGAASDDSG